GELSPATQPRKPAPTSVPSVGGLVDCCGGAAASMMLVFVPEAWGGALAGAAAAGCVAEDSFGASSANFRTTSLPSHSNVMVSWLKASSLNFPTSSPAR